MIPPSRSGKKKRPDRQQREKGDEGQLVAPLRAQNRNGEPRRDEQFHQTGEMIPVHVRAKGDATVLEFPHPI